MLKTGMRYRVFIEQLSRYECRSGFLRSERSSKSCCACPWEEIWGSSYSTVDRVAKAIPSRLGEQNISRAIEENPDLETDELKQIEQVPN
jgi:hypothetical protein